MTKRSLGTWQKIGTCAANALLAWLILMAAACDETRQGSSPPLGRAAQAVVGAHLTAQVALQSDWGSGYVAEVTVQNQGDTATTAWTVELVLEGSTVSGSPWNARHSELSAGLVRFTNEAYNGSISPESSVSFGFVAAVSNGPSVPVVRRVQAEGADSGAEPEPEPGDDDGESSVGEPSGGELGLELVQGSDEGPFPVPEEPDWYAASAGKMLPTDPVGALPGASSVTQDGAFTYQIPIRVPPGRNGMEPTLALSYSSRAANGPLGVGWSISGLSTISRCRKTLAHEEMAEGILLDATDRFCLDGQKLEILSGSYGGDGAVYATERFTGSRIRSYGQGAQVGEPGWFEVRLGNGRILTYGKTSEALNRALYYPDRSELTVTAEGTLGWLLDSVSDRFGNAMLFRYDSFEGVVAGNWNAGRKLTEVTYTENDAAGLEASRIVRFHYEIRPDLVEHNTSGVSVRLPERLAQVEVLGPKTPNGEPKTLWRYHLAYHPTGEMLLQSRLSSVEWCDAEGGCLPRTEFDWGAAQWHGDGLRQSEVEEKPAEPKYVEMWRMPEPVFVENYAWLKLDLVDIDGDGRDDLVYHRAYDPTLPPNTPVANLKVRPGAGPPWETSMGTVSLSSRSQRYGA